MSLQTRNIFMDLLGVKCNEFLLPCMSQCLHSLMQVKHHSYDPQKKYVFLFISLFVYPLPFAGFPTFLVTIAVAINTLIHGNMDRSIRNDAYVANNIINLTLHNLQAYFSSLKRC